MSVILGYYYLPKHLLDRRMVDNNKDSDNEMVPGLSMNRRSALAVLGLGTMGTTRSSANMVDDSGKKTERKEIQSENNKEKAYLEEMPPGDRFGKVEINDIHHTLQVSGTRRPAWMVRPFPNGITTTSTSYEETDANIGYGLIPFPPGHVPVLRIVGHFDNAEESTASIRVSIANRPAYTPPGLDSPRVLSEDPVQKTLLEVTGQGQTQVFDETYLTDAEDVVSGVDNAHPLPSHTLLCEVKTDRSRGQATIGNGTTLSLELEAL